MLDSVSDILDRILTKDQQVFLIRSGWVLFVTGHIMWVCGWLTFMGVSPPFVQSQELSRQSEQVKEQFTTLSSQFSTLTEQLRQQRVEDLQRQINDTEALFCHAQKVHNLEAVSLYDQQLQWLTKRYISQAKDSPSVTPCARLVGG